MTGTESTPLMTQVMYRWDNHDDDREVYDEIFDEAIFMIANDDPVGKLLMMIINSWERNRRSIPMPVINAAYEVTLSAKAAREMADASL